MKTFLSLLAPIGVLALVVFAILWGPCRIPVQPGYMAIVTAKVGRPLPPGEILAGPGEKGVRRDPLPEGRHFLNPINYDWKIVPVLTVPVGNVALVTSKTGAELPPGEILAADRSGKGVWKDVLGPGTYRLNPEGYDIQMLDAVHIPIGYVGVVTAQTGKPVKPGEFAGPGEQGVMRDVLQPGLYYINPRAYQVDVLEIGMNQVSIIGRSGSVVLTKGDISSASGALDSLKDTTIQQQKAKRDEYLAQNAERGFLSQSALSSQAVQAEAAGGESSWSSLARSKRAVRKTEDSLAPQTATQRAASQTPQSVAFGINRFVEFPSRDGFQILLDMTVEFELLPENISRIYMLYGDLPAVVEKIILPQVLSVSRLRGSSYKARDFIDGDGRQAFQAELTSELTRVLSEKHILIHNAIIRHVEIPQEILEPIQTASLAKEQDLTNKERQNTARRQAELNTETAMVDQLKKQVEQESAKLVATIAAETKNQVAGIRAGAALDVATINLERSTVQASIIQVKGEAEIQAAFRLDNERAAGEKLRGAVFQDPASLADLTFVDKLNPAVGIRILHAGEGTLWTDLEKLTPTLPVK
ncbi:MAG: hypothetical protein GX571_04075 [Lentisphaerae bacterium]|jgi:hypothetical protein|nr:hypothetical protein [Lentisphaerota bacterium]